MPEIENNPSSSNTNDATTSSRGHQSPNNGYSALRNTKGANSNQNNDSDANKKTAKVAAKAAANHFAGPVGGKAVDALANTKLGNDILNKGGQLLNKIPGMSKATNKLNNSGALDAADNVLSANQGSGGSSENALKGQSQETSALGGLSTGAISKAKSAGKGGSSLGKSSFSGEEEIDENEGKQDADFSSEITGLVFFNKKTILEN